MTERLTLTTPELKEGDVVLTNGMEVEIQWGGQYPYQPGTYGFVGHIKNVEEVDDQGIAGTLRHDDCSAQECVDTLIAAALDWGGSDNVTAILVRCH